MGRELAASAEMMGKMLLEVPGMRSRSGAAEPEAQGLGRIIGFGEAPPPRTPVGEEYSAT